MADTPKAKLAKYRSMRDFKKTREPAGSDAPKQGKALRYLIQKHEATRLHYDFRLEWGGVLWSWAVTRGPSLDSADKRLAVHTEDHPIEYGTFEGTIPAGEYGGGTVMLWDEGSWEPVGNAEKDYKKGKLHFRLFGERLKGEWVLLKMRGKAATEKRENWLLIKVEDKYAKAGKGDYAVEKFTTSVTTKRKMEQIAGGAKVWKHGKAVIEKAKVKKSVSKNIVEVKEPSARSKAGAASTSSKSPKKSDKKERVPSGLELQLATLVDAPPVGAGWVHEIKFDGYRALARAEGRNVSLITRAGNDWTTKFQGITDALEKSGIKDALIDGEVVVLRDGGGMGFADLQNALSEGKQDKLHYYAFDLLYADGENLMDLSLLERKRRLQKILPEGHEKIHYSEHFTQKGSEVLHNACSIALEGIISKRSDAPYRPGRGKDWLKSKCIHEQEFVIGGYTLPSNGSRGIGALLLGYYEKDLFVYCGRVGTGFNHKMSEELRKRLHKIERKTMPYQKYSDNGRRGAGWKRGVIWVEPKYVAQVAFAEWTPEGSLRHPSFQGLREDKPATEITREKAKHTSTILKAAKSEASGKPSTIKKPEQEKASRRAASARGTHPNTNKVSAARASSVRSKSNGPRQIGGVTLTHPARLLYADDKITKAELAEYYIQVSRWMLPHVAGRPVSIVRCPEGTAGQCFFQRHASPGMPEAIKEVDLDSEGKDREPYLVLDDEDGLVASVQTGGLELHVWGAQANDVERPDRIVFDFDPGDDVPWSRVKKAAREMRAWLRRLKLESFVKTTGGKGLHVVLPFNKGPSWEDVKEFALAMCTLMMQDNPKRYTVNMKKSERKGKIYLDYLRNERTASAVAPYSSRARAHAPVAMPIAWEDLGKLKSGSQFTIRNAPAHLKRRKKDPWERVGKVKQKLPL